MLETLEQKEVGLLQRLTNYFTEVSSLKRKIDDGRSPPEKQKKRQKRLLDLKNRLIPKIILSLKFF